MKYLLLLVTLTSACTSAQVKPNVLVIHTKDDSLDDCVAYVSEARDGIMHTTICPGRRPVTEWHNYPEGMK